MAKINYLFKMLKQQGASDLHISSGAPPLFRLHGEMMPLNYPALSHDQAKGLVYEILFDEQKQAFEEKNDLDFAYELQGVARFRGNLMMTHRGIAAVFRIIPSKILTADDLNLPEGVRKLTRMKKGLVLVTGPTGSGKSTTLAAMIDLINSTRKEHILTIEDPLEFVHQNKNHCSISARSEPTRIRLRTLCGLLCARTRTLFWSERCATWRRSPWR